MEQVLNLLLAGLGFLICLITLRFHPENVQEKKRVFAWRIISADCLALGTIPLLKSVHPPVYLATVLIMSVVTLDLIISVRTCETCGKEIYIKRYFDRNTCCHKCNRGLSRVKQYHTED